MAEPDSSSSASSVRRGRGARAGLDRARILEAARDLDPTTLTMQSLADRLGVDRKALNYHVSDRDNLLELLAIDAFLTRFADIRIDPDTDWKDACRALAGGIRRSIEETGERAMHFRFTTQRDLAAVGPAEIVAERMLAAGFDRETISRGMHLLMTMSAGFARDAIMARGQSQHPQIAELEAVLGQSTEGFDTIRDLIAAHVDNYGDEQFAFDLETFFAGMQSHLAERPQA